MILLEISDAYGQTVYDTVCFAASCAGQCVFSRLYIIICVCVYAGAFSEAMAAGHDNPAALYFFGE